MIVVPITAVTELLKREPPNLIAATGIFFEVLGKHYSLQTIQAVLESHRSGVWGEEGVEGCGFPVLRSTNMRGSRADVSDVAWRKVPEKQAAACALQTGDILVTKSSGSSDLVGKSVLFIQPEDRLIYLFSNFTHRLRPNPKIVEPSYLAWFLRSPQALEWRFMAQQNAVGLRNLQMKEFLSQLVPTPPLPIQRAIARYLDGLESGKDFSSELPSQLAEQHRIVSRIEELAAKVEEAQTARNDTTQAADTLVGAEIQRLFGLGPKSGWNEGQLGDYVVDECYGTSEKTHNDSSGTPILRMGNIQNGGLDINNLKYLHIKDRDRGKWILQDGDILVNRTNSAELVGKCAVFDLEGEYGFASYIIRLRLDTGRALPRLVAAYINSPIGRAYMFSERKQMTGQANVNAKKLKALPIALPQLEEQRDILARLEDLKAKVDELKKLQSETSAELDALMPSILDKAFRGEL